MYLTQSGSLLIRNKMQSQEEVIGLFLLGVRIFYFDSIFKIIINI